jgi:murein DD-endopeptidase MepM/ murein hydrolase activator NlpD
LKQEVDALQDQVKQKQTRIKELDALIKGYRDKQVEQQNTALSLQNELALLENGIQEKQLSAERAQREVESTTLEIQALGNQIALQKQAIDKRESSLSDIFVKLQQDSSISVFDAFLSRPSLSELFVRLDELGRLEGDLGEATRVLKSEKVILETKRKQQEDRRAVLEQQKLEAQVAQTELEEQRLSKLSLINATQNKEDEFRKVVYELRQQQQSEAGDIQSLQDRLKDRLDSIDAALARGDVLLNWPIPVKKGISAHFHDPSYPFRKLFEHPGVDLPAPVGTPVKAAAGGYVAWNRTGKQYGNYVMVVHAGGVATVYAHLSKFGAKPDTYVERGDVIGYSGGRPGDAGAGLSTGAHLHFEVRQNGIPVNPENFLPDL